MLPDHEYPIPQREPLIGIIRIAASIAACPTATLADAAITSAVLLLPHAPNREHVNESQHLDPAELASARS
jgi:hypothetical protein